MPGNRRICQCVVCDGCQTGASLPNINEVANQLCSKCKKGKCITKKKKTKSLRARKKEILALSTRRRSSLRRKSQTSLSLSTRYDILSGRERQFLPKPENACLYISMMGKYKDENLQVIHTDNMGYGLFARNKIQKHKEILRCDLPIYRCLSKKVLSLVQNSRYWMKCIDKPAFYSLHQGLQDTKYGICSLNSPNEGTLENAAFEIAEDCEAYEDGYDSLCIIPLRDIEKDEQILVKYNIK